MPDSRRRRLAAGLALAPLALASTRSPLMADAPQVIDDAESDDLRAPTGTKWRLVTDQVMGGVSEGTVRKETVAGRRAVHLAGEVSLDNNGGFVQMTLDLAADGGTVDASAWTGIAATVRGNGAAYNLHLRTSDVRRPWQSYRHGFQTDDSWQTVHLPFAAFEPHRIDAPLDVSRLKRVGIVAIGREMAADVAVADLRFYR